VGEVFRKLRTYFITGLLVISPVVVTAWILWKLFRFTDGFLGELIARYTERSIPGLGFIATVVLVLFIGLFASNLLGRRLIGLGEYVLRKIPFVNRLYVGVQQIAGVVFRDKKPLFQKVVAVEFPRKGVYAVAFLTNEITSPFDPEGAEEMVTVFLPTTPNPTSGYLLLLSSKEVHSLPMNVEEGVKFVVSGGAVVPEHWSQRVDILLRRGSDG